MEELWTAIIPDIDVLHWNLACKPLFYKNTIVFAYSTTDKNNKDINGCYGTKIVVLQISTEGNIVNQNSISLNYSDEKEKQLIRNIDWLIYQDSKNDLYLDTGVVFNINESKISLSNVDSKIKKRLIEDDYTIDDLHIKYNQRFLLECYDNKNELLWKLKIKGYLYTELINRNEYLLFGTAGQGGAFYCINKKTGTILTEYVNGDSSNFYIGDNFVITRDKNGNISKINPYRNEIIETLRLKDKVTYDTPYTVYNNKVYIVVCSKKTKQDKILCIQI